jgi:protein SCO1/2
MQSRHVYFYLFIVVLIIIIGLVFHGFLSDKDRNQDNQVITIKKTTTSGTPSIGGSFRLINHNGDVVSDKSYTGQYLIVFFGYTFCPDVCPNTLVKFSTVMDQLGEYNSRVTPLFITVDPVRDTVQVMSDYISNFHPRIEGLTGNKKQIKHIKNIYKVYGAKSRANTENLNDYIVDHSSLSYFMGTGGEYVDFFNYNMKASSIVSKIKKIITTRK